MENELKQIKALSAYLMDNFSEDELIEKWNQYAAKNRFDCYPLIYKGFDSLLNDFFKGSCKALVRSIDYDGGEINDVDHPYFTVSESDAFNCATYSHEELEHTSFDINQLAEWMLDDGYTLELKKE